MNGIGKKLLSVVAFIAAFVAVKYGMETYREHKAVAEGEKSFRQIESDGTKRHPNLPVSEAIHQEAIAKSSEKINAEVDENKRLQTAASIFLGYFLVNTRERTEYCREHGIDIGPFVSAFERGHSKELARARAILSGSNVDVNKIYTMLKPQLRQVVTLDMNDIAATNKTSAKQACEIIATNGPALAVEMHFSKIQPVVYKALSTAN